MNTISQCHCILGKSGGALTIAPEFKGPVSIEEGRACRDAILAQYRRLLPKNMVDDAIAQKRLDAAKE